MPWTRRARPAEEVDAAAALLTSSHPLPDLLLAILALLGILALKP